MSRPDALAPRPDAAVELPDGPAASPDAFSGTADATMEEADALAAVPDAARTAPDATVDPCHGIPLSGVCASTSEIEACVIPEGGDPRLITLTCQPGEGCQLVNGTARCEPTGTCGEGVTECTSATQIRTCIGGAWQAATCPRSCLATPLGDFCGLDAPTTAFTANIQYEVRGPNVSLTDWGSLVLVPAQGFAVLSVRVLQDGTVIPIDAAVTGEGPTAGSFSVQVPVAPQAGDALLAVATQADAAKQISIVLLDPALTPSANAYAPGTMAAQPRLWFWTWALPGLASGSQLTIPETAGSGAARVFDYMRYISENTAARWPGRFRLRFIVWLGGGVSWTCGSCFSQQLGFQLGTVFGGQVWLNGGPDAEYWADSVTAHELGHWAMASYGHSVREGGPHFLGQPATPGLAWSEGYATWFSSDVRQDPIYFDKQHGTAFWLDISDRATSGSPWPRPIPQAGLYQPMYEDEVSAMLWNLSATQGLTSAPLDAALDSARMTIAPFLRGYLTPLGVNTTFLADFLDALACEGVSPNSLDLATDPSVHYPYDSRNPLCSRAPGPRATLRLDVVNGSPIPGTHMHLRVELVRDPSWPYPVSFSFNVPVGSVMSSVVARSSVGTDVADLELDLGSITTSDIVAVADSRSVHAGFHAEARYRFGRPEPTGRVPLRTGPHLHLGTLDLGAAIPGTVR